MLLNPSNFYKYRGHDLCVLNGSCGPVQLCLNKNVKIPIYISLH